MDEERRQREYVRDEAIASARLEGEEVGSETSADLEAYVRGELTLDEVEARTLARYSGRTGRD
ncbi:antitoxin VbhA family protein [Marinitenerispora sediminis]|uniref:Antitoxin n=1 Tax=Marinitenerispora sediminis TaxID=1931232 RepID=A0A368T2Q8_9ACTN|nr:antitoxin VbhA family protein [Marinitenerispora sediminis]RCV49116.1 antitoxin [Marinitenerispora sediminis]RCV51841.1 antitoxin [Marinitenerispora sediminis]RCV55810.1 antitoxin [Marinitenerispora sediminis]